MAFAMSGKEDDCADYYYRLEDLLRDAWIIIPFLVGMLFYKLFSKHFDGMLLGMEKLKGDPEEDEKLPTDDEESGCCEDPGGKNEAGTEKTAVSALKLPIPVRKSPILNLRLEEDSDPTIIAQNKKD